MTDLRQRLLEAFAVEYREHLTAAREILGSGGRSEGVNDAGIVELHRRVHSLKGAARATDLKPLETLAHRLESYLARMQEGTIALDERAAQVIHAGLDAIEDWFGEYIEAGSAGELDAAISIVEAALSGESEPNVKAGPVAELQEPDAADARAATSDLVAAPNKGTHEPPSEDHEAPSEAAPTVLRDSVRIDVESLDRLLRCAGDMLIASGQIRQSAPEFTGIAKTVEQIKKEIDAFQSHLAKRATSGNAEDLEPVQEARDLAGKIQTLSVDLLDLGRRQGDFAWRTMQLSHVLRDEVQQVRMVPAENVFGNFRKMVRDIARDEDKQVEFHMSGSDTRADRRVLQELKDPVLHILRNAIAHGIELPENRAETGKDRTGNIHVAIAARGSRLVLRVEDDGKGLDLAAIDRKARERGLLPDDTPAIERYDQAQAVLLHPGFSTAAGVDTLSGRGLGLSIVHQAVSRLQGDLELGTSQYGGLAVVLTFPLSVATNRVVMVEASGQRYALPSNGIERIYRFSPRDLEQSDGTLALTLPDRKEAVGVASLQWLLGREGISLQATDKVTLILLATASGRVAVAVDEALSVREVVIEKLDNVLQQNDLVGGTALVDDGKVVPLLNPLGLIERFNRAGSVEKLHIGHTSVDALPPTILVVDDSITTRTLEKSILEANGYTVHLSVDGLDALSRLRSTPVDIVVSDVQMPRMDGFTLVSEIKKDRKLSETPVILVTSRDDPKDRQRGLSVGADAYVLKQRFDQTNLLETIRQLI